MIPGSCGIRAGLGNGAIRVKEEDRFRDHISKEPRALTPKEYEAYVAELVRQLDFCKNARLFRNQKFLGVRQPGEYEIDVAVKVKLSEAVDFFLIVECKNWKRPVDRPVIQKLAQTRDAISAHKAAVVSPVGFTAEAVSVAEAHGIALWIISQASWTIVMPMGMLFGGVTPIEVKKYKLLSWKRYKLHRFRKQLLTKLGFRMREQSTSSLSQHDTVLIDVRSGYGPFEAKTPWVRFQHYCRGFTMNSGEPGVDPRTALAQLADELANMLGIAEGEEHRENNGQ